MLTKKQELEIEIKSLEEALNQLRHLNWTNSGWSYQECSVCKVIRDRITPLKEQLKKYTDKIIWIIPKRK